MLMGELNKPWAVTLVNALYFINTTLPALITGGAYTLIIYTVSISTMQLSLPDIQKSKGS